MQKLYSFSLITASLLFAHIAFSQATLTTSPYVETFDDLHNGLPTGFTVRTGSNNTSLGNAVTPLLTPSSNNSTGTNWTSTAGGFKNFASGALGLAGIGNFSAQLNAADRALGIRQTGSLGDPFSAFVFQIENTVGKTNFELTFDLQSLDSTSPRKATWRVQYGIGDNPTQFYDAATVSGNLATGDKVFSNNSVVANFGSALDNKNEVVSIRIVTLSSTTGSGNRPTTAIDNFSLAWIDEGAGTPYLTITDSSNNPINSLAFAFNPIGTAETLSYILNGKNLTEPVAVEVEGDGFLISSDGANFTTNMVIPEWEAVDKVIYVQYYANFPGNHQGEIIHTSQGASVKTLSLAGQVYDPINRVFDFNTCVNGGTPGQGFIQYSVTGAQIWTCTDFGFDGTNGVNINGYAAGNANENEDWLISPPLNLNSYPDFPILSFRSRGEFSGPSLTLWISHDYDGTGNPNDFNWTKVDAHFPPLNNSWALTEGIDLSDYKSGSVYIAFKYLSGQETGAARWTLDDVKITNQSKIFSTTPPSLYFTEQAVGTHSSGIPVLVKAIGYGDITVQAPTDFTLSADDINYSSWVSLSAAQAEAGAQLFVRFSPTSKKLVIIDSLVFTNGSDLNSKAVAIAGSSYPKAETLDAGAYNLSFFGSTGSDAIIRTPQQITAQIENIAEVFNRMKLDVAGFEEMSSDSSLNEMVSYLNNISGQTYAALVSDRYSYFFEPDDPAFPSQKIGLLYNSETMTLSTEEPPRAMFANLYDSIRNGTATLSGYPSGNSAHFWASGRLPFMATFNTNITGVSRKVRVIVIHAKAGADKASYDRRKFDAQVLKDSIEAHYGNDRIILLGDYNDRLFGSITVGQPSAYESFVSENEKYTALTYSLDEAGKTSFPGSSGMIDHILISNHLLPAYLGGSGQIEPANSYISPYDKVVGSDHLPVYARFDLQKLLLPVSVTNFSGKLVNNGVLLTWATAMESSNARFIVQRSPNGSQFITIGEVEGAGNSNTFTNYYYTDKSPLNGANYYRLLQQDWDGTITIHNTIRVMNDSQRKNELQVYPNPVQQNTKVRLVLPDAMARYKATFVNQNGGVILKADGTADQLTDLINQSLRRSPSGVYVLHLSSATEQHNVKLIKY